MDISAPMISRSTSYQWSCPSSDSERYSTSSPDMASPDCSMEFSPSCASATAPTSAFHGGIREPSSSSCSKNLPGSKMRRSRSKNPSKQRQNASEKEKLRMRDLTKALHHLRTYLPPSVAPAGQTLTKIETLRLTIRYISYLSAQLGLSEEILTQKKEQDVLRCQAFPEFLDFCQTGTVPLSHWGAEQAQEEGSGQYQNTLSTPACNVQSSAEAQQQFTGTVSTVVQDSVFNSSMDSLLASPQYTHPAHSFQMFDRDVNCQAFPQEYWI